MWKSKRKDIGGCIRREKSFSTKQEDVDTLVKKYLGICRKLILQRIVRQEKEENLENWEELFEQRSIS